MTPVHTAATATATATATAATRQSVQSTSTVTSSSVFVVNALEKFANAKETRRNKALKEAVLKAQNMLKNDEAAPEGQTRSTVILAALQTAIDTRSANLMTIALDCLGKFITYNYLDDMEDEAAQTQMMEKMVDSICACFIGEETDEKVQLQIIKALLDAVYSTRNPLHQATLLKAVRTAYNIFLLSRNSANQNVAQVTLTQMIDHIFRRIQIRPHSRGTEAEGQENGFKGLSVEDTSEAVVINALPEASDISYQQQIIVEANMACVEMDQKLPSGRQKDNSEDFLNDTATIFEDEIVEESKKVEAIIKQESSAKNIRNSIEASTSDSAEASTEDTLENHTDNGVEAPIEMTQESNTEALATEDIHRDEDKESLKESEQESDFEGERINPLTAENIADLYIKDAILVFRALCKLSKKQIASEWGNDMRSYSMRSKLLSLHLILTILTSHMNIMSSPLVTLSSSNDPNLTPSNPFILEVKQYLCPSLAKNAFSLVPQVFDITLEILWKVVEGLRIYLKKEIEVFFKEIVFRILEMRNASFQQKHSLLKIILRICSDPQTLVDIYLNYDCDGQALDNIYERLVYVLSKITTSQNSPGNNPKDQEIHASGTDTLASHGNLYHKSVVIPPPLTTATVLSNEKQSHSGPQLPESAIKFKSLECLVAVLQSLVTWYANNSVSVSANANSEEDNSSGNTPRQSEDHRMSTERTASHGTISVPRMSPSPSSGGINSSTTTNGPMTLRMDDPEQFENLKHRKQLLQDGIRLFNWKPKKGMQLLAKHGFLDISDPISKGKFLLHTEGLSKAFIGEYLGEGEPDNIATMHAFVDELDFTDMQFVEALREYLQHFRLPGEAQKIDRFMLKFAERYVHGNPGVFANADTAYVLAYHVIMLNTDQHNPTVKRPMTYADFVKNNRGLDDGNNISEVILEFIFNDIQKNEIMLNDEIEAANNAALMATTGGMGALGIAGLQNALTSAGLMRDARREAYQAATEEMGSKTEAIFRSMLASRRCAGENETFTFYIASHVEHVRPMFEVAWMAFLAGISGALQKSDDLETVHLCLIGFKHAIRIICLFHTVQSEDMDLQRDAFVTTLTKFTFLTNLNEMKPKNVEAIKTLLEVAAVDGNYLKGSWKEILSTVSQLERFQLITSGVDQRALPDISTKRLQPNSKASVDMVRRSSTLRSNRSSGRSGTQLSLTEEVASAGSSQSLVLAADKLFTATVNLNGDAIVDFVRALCETSWEEIASSAHLEHPRMYSLQKLVEISYYNMNRIRIEWSNLWAILGDYYNKVGCQSNFNVAFFALDSLRQLAMRFLEKEELPHFKFQKDFLMPFRNILANNPNVAIKDMVLRCLSQMILARAQNIRSGWKTMLSVFAIGARETSESIVHMTFDIVRSVANERFNDIIANGTFPDYISCLVEFSKNKKFQKISLPALDMIKGTIPGMLEIAEKTNVIEITDAHTLASSGQTSQPGDDFLVKFWFAVLYGLKEVTMQSDDVEVRKRALQYLFETLKAYGSTFTPDFWTTISRQIVFPIFDDLKSNSDHQRTLTPEDLSVWLSTTMIEALRNVVDLYTFYFESIKGMMRPILGLFGVCITQDNDTLARIGCECLEQYIETNVEKFDLSCWDLVAETFVHLFEKTTARGLFDDTKDLVNMVKATPSADTDPVNGQYNEPSPSHPDVSEERQQSFQQVIVKCVLQLMLIQTVNELLSKDAVYCAFPTGHLMQIMECLGRSFHFAKRFNNDNDLRMALWRFGFMKQLPNLLKQETSSGGCYVSVLMRMYANLENISDRDDRRMEIEAILIPLCNEIFALYAELDHETKPKNIAAWTPVVVSILNGLAQLQDEDFLRHVPKFYMASVELLGQDSLLLDIRMSLRTLLIRVGKSYEISAEKNI
ncbi:hypothetical protein BDF14DRAFT_1995182 [Spinellus fusiger]|nr:hypothetical protein BDF14DRAFT_1995182 [Spinellus fusiger]